MSYLGGGGRSVDVVALPFWNWLTPLANTMRALFRHGWMGEGGALICCLSTTYQLALRLKLRSFVAALTMRAKETPYDVNYNLLSLSRSGTAGIGSGESQPHPLD